MAASEPPAAEQAEQAHSAGASTNASTLMGDTSAMSPR